MNDATEPSMDSSGLYKEETFTDRKVGTITKLSPVTREGGPDAAREEIYLGATQIMTPAGALPINFEIEASSLGEASDKFGELAKNQMDETIKELQELQRQQASSIVVPGQGQGAGIHVP